MSNIVDNILADICLDERITDGIFRLEEEEHMNVLRDYLFKRGLAREDTIQVTNRMLEGKYPERQAYRVSDGILITWPTPEYKAKAMAKEPGKYSDKNPNPEKQNDRKKSTAPTPPSPTSSKEEPLDKELPEKDSPLPKSDEPEDKGGNLFHGDKKLEVEPPHGDEKLKPAGKEIQSDKEIPKSPERIAAEKEVIQQILATDDTSLTSLDPQLKETLLNHQLCEIVKKCNEWSFYEAIKFIKPHIKI